MPNTFFLKNPIVICDDDSTFLNQARIDLDRIKANIILTSQQDEAYDYINRSDQTYSGFLLNPKTAYPMGIPLIRAAIQYHPTTPLFLLTDDPLTQSEQDEYKNLIIRKYIKKNLGLVGVLKEIIDVTTYLKISSYETTESPNKNDDFIPISFRSLATGISTPFELFEKYEKREHVSFKKILNAGAVLAAEQLLFHINQMQTHFYISKNSHEKYLKYCDYLTAKTILSESSSEKTKVEQTLNLGNKTLDFLKLHGIDSAAISYAENFSINVQSLIKKIDLENNSKIKKYLNDLANHEHCVGTSVIASLLAKDLGFEHEKTTEIIGVASFLHDIGISELNLTNEDLVDEDESKMTPEVLKIFRTHPTVGAKILSSLKGIEPAIIQTVEQHHERRNRTGYPNRLGVGQINKISEIVGISEVYMRLIRQHLKSPNFNPIRIMREKHLDGFSTPIADSFFKLFI